MSGGSSTRSTSSGASATGGRPGMNASATPATTSTIELGVLSRRAITAAATSTARRRSKVCTVAVMRRASNRARRDVHGQCQQCGIENKRNDAVTEHSAPNRLAAYADVGNLGAHSEGEREVHEVPVIGVALVVRGVHATAAAVVFIVIFMGVMQSEYRVCQRPGHEDCKDRKHEVGRLAAVRPGAAEQGEYGPQSRERRKRGQRENCRLAFVLEPRPASYP